MTERRMVWTDRPRETVDEREELGLAAKAFLENPLYKRAVDELSEGFLQLISDSKPDQAAQREEAYRMYRCVQAVNEIFTGWRADATMIKGARAEKARQDGDAPVEEEREDDG